MAVELHDYNKSHLNYTIFADVDLHKSAQTLIVNFEFYLSDPQSLVLLPSHHLAQPVREDNLWKTTCFEFFLQVGEQKSYYEFNFSPQGAWNQYYFTDYRNPQPPQISNDFELVKLDWKASTKKITGELQSSKVFDPQFKIGITAVIEEKSGDKKYFALSHAGHKPDFHLQNSFTYIKEL